MSNNAVDDACLIQLVIISSHIVTISLIVSTLFAYPLRSRSLYRRKKLEV
ncbi:hypothetical protein X777_13980 [Ooceraea biroi]|uniref:Uncharacterized protein n=1 Tax=Ooceraea biroi TaxID=2015173 RepID=A0A026WXF6_OOCBI|nr:hypothetical protein X777_13980 [Ooceraea biroi]